MAVHIGQNRCLKGGTAVDNNRKLTLLSTFIYFKMQHISILILLIYIPKQTSALH